LRAASRLAGRVYLSTGELAIATSLLIEKSHEYPHIPACIKCRCANPPSSLQME
jgi:hypothetical protein